MPLRAGVGRAVRERGPVPLHHPAGEVPLRRPDRPTGRSVQLDGDVGDAAGGDVGGHVELAAAHDAEVDHALACGGVELAVGGCQAGVVERVHQRAERLVVVDPAEELPDRPEVVDVVDQRGAGKRHQQRPDRTGPDAVGQREDVLRALRRLVLDEVGLVHDHAAEAEIAEPAQVPVEQLVVEHDDVGEAVDALAVAPHDGGRAVWRPVGRLAGPVGLDDVRYDDEQRVGARRLGREQRLRRLAQTRLVGEQERPVAGGGRGDHLPLVRHQLQPRRGEPGRRRRQRHRRRGPGTGAFERAQQRADQLPAGQPSRAGGALRDRGEVGGEEGVRELPRDHRAGNDPPLRAGGVGRGRRRRALFGRRLDAELPQQLPLARSGRVGDVGVLGQQRHEPGVADGGRREHGRDAVQALELLDPTAVAAGRLPDAGALVPQQQGDGLELRPHGRRHLAAADGRLDPAGVLRERRDHVTALAGSPPARDGTAGARLALARSSHRFLLVHNLSNAAGTGARGSVPGRGASRVPAGVAAGRRSSDPGRRRLGVRCDPDAARIAPE